MSKFQKNKGITLIALIVTIIVLLILAGVTISAITGSENSIQKAQEARNENDKGAMKDSASLLATNYIQEYYDKVYVQSDSTFKTTYANAGLYAKAQFPNASVGGYTYAVSGDTLTITDTKGNIVTGTILENGNISWSDGGQQNTNTVETLAKAGTIKVGDYVNYTPSSGSITVTSAQTGHSADQTFNTANETGMTWRVLSVNETTGEVKIVGSPTTTQLTLYGKAGFGNAEIVLNNIGAIFGGGTGASSARSITEDDVFDAIGYDKVANYKGGTDTFTSGELFTETWDETTGTATYSTTTTIATPENPVTLHNLMHNGFDDNGDWIGGINTASQTLENGTTDEKENMKKVWDMLIGGNYGATWDNGNYDYWCASRFRTDWGYCGDPNYFVRYVAYGWINSGCYGEDLYGSAKRASRTHSVVPILILQSNIGIEKDNNIWNFVE